MARNPDAQPIEYDKAERLEVAMRSLIAGDPRGSVRRTVLYIVVSLSMLAMLAIGGGWAAVAMAPGLVALMVLANSDDLL